MSHRFCISLLGVIALAGSAPAQLSVGPNVNISKMAGNQTEGTIAVNPVNPNNLFVASNVDAGNFLFGAISVDGGLTWAKRNLATGADGLAAACCDATAAFDSFGNLFLAYINSATNAIIIGLSTNSGASFTTLFTITGSIDQPTIATGPGSVWITYNSGGSIVARGAAVTGLGTVGALSAVQAAPGSSGGNFGDIVIGPGGKMIVIYESPSGGQGPASLLTNLDLDGLGAGGFGAAVLASTTNVGGFDFIPPQPSRSVDAEAGLMWDFTGGAFNNRLYLVYNEEPINENNDTEIYFRTSNTNGTSWSAPVRLNSDATTRSQFLPKIALDRATGHIAVVWMDARNDPGNVRSELWGTASIDGGATFLPNIKISAGGSIGTQAATGSSIEFGDYIGLTMHNDRFYPVWADSSNSTLDNPNGTTRLDIYTARVTIPPQTGACCVSTACSITTMAGCGGAFQGVGTVCGPLGNPTTCCRANINGVNGVTVQDLFDFLALWFALSPQADINGVNGVTVQDLFDFLALWFAGCPG